MPKRKYTKSKSKIETKVQKVEDLELKKDSNVTREDVKFRVTFLAMQFFRGRHYKTGESIVLTEKDAQAYSKRTGLKIEPLLK